MLQHRSDFTPTKVFTNSNGYVVASNGKTVRRHHVWLWEKQYGSIPQGHELHHVNGCRTDNDLGNLVLMKIGDHRRLHCLARIESIKSQVRQQPRDLHGRWIAIKK